MLLCDTRRRFQVHIPKLISPSSYPSAHIPKPISPSSYPPAHIAKLVSPSSYPQLIQASPYLPSHTLQPISPAPIPSSYPQAQSPSAYLPAISPSSYPQAHISQLISPSPDLLGIVVQPLDLHLVNLALIPTGPTHGKGRLQPRPGDYSRLAAGLHGTDYYSRLDYTPAGVNSRALTPRPFDQAECPKRAPDQA